MSSHTHRKRAATGASEATVTSKGQITLPKPIRERLGLQAGSRIRFLLDEHGGFQGEPVLLDLEDLWQRADATPQAGPTLTAAEMDKAKARRSW